MNVQQIGKNHLKKNGYDGLCGCDQGCTLEDLATCYGDFGFECHPGYNDPEKAKRHDCLFWMTLENPKRKC